MTELHVISALRTKRAEVSGYIRDLENRIRQQRANLTHIDATIRLYAPHIDPEGIEPVRTYRRSRYFIRGELSNRCMDALREAAGPVSSDAVTVRIMTDKGWNPDDQHLRATIGLRVQERMRALSKKNLVVRIGTTRDAKWQNA